jgi:hypothetical protein
VRRVLICLVMLVLAMAGGCTATSGPTRIQISSAVVGCSTDTQAAEYLEGFMDGYNSASPHRGYNRESTSCRLHSPYSHGWHDGYCTGVGDERQRD